MSRKVRYLLAGGAACVSTAALLGACATDAATPLVQPDASNVAVVTEQDAAPDAPDAEIDAGPCADCAYFPEECTEEVLCPNGPFAPDTIGGALDERTQINVVRGRSATDVWAVGALGAVAHFDGTRWSRSDSGTRQTLLALWLRDSAEVAFGSLDALHTRGLTDIDAGAPSPGGWSSYGAPTTPPDYSSFLVRFASAWAAPDGEWLWCAMVALAPGFSSGLWRLHVAEDTGTFEVGSVVSSDVCGAIPCSQMTSVHGASRDDVWAVGMFGAIVRITNAESATPEVTPFDSQTFSALRGVWAASASEAWAVGAQGTIRHYRGEGVRWDVVEDVPTNEDLNAVWGRSANDVWAVGAAGVVLHYDGTHWTRVPIASLGSRRPELTTVWSPLPGHVWIGGQGIVLSLGGKP